MKGKFLLIALFLATLLVMSCQGLTSATLGGEDAITPSSVIITEERNVSDFSGIEVRSFGKVILSQGDNESVTIRGSDNIVPIIQTSVRGGNLVIQTKENIEITGLHDENVPTFTIVVKDLSSLSISGAADIEMGSLSTSKLEVTMSGAGQFVLDQLLADSLNIMLSGFGNVEISGEVAKAWIDISGAGNVEADDLKIQTADITIPGMGNATLWVTEQLTGNISGGGSVSYYGNPQTDVETTGFGQFKSLGNK
jgi:hypothetical protein